VACQPGTPVPSPVPTPTRVQIIVTTARTPTPEQAALPGDHIRGKADAPITETLYCDFSMPACFDLAREMLSIQQRHPNDVRLIWRHFPAANSDRGRMAAQASEAAAAQGKFWEYHDQLLANQAAWRELPLDQLRAKLSEFATLAGVPDLNTFNADVNSQKYSSVVVQNGAEAIARGFKAAPVILFQDQQYVGDIDEFTLEGQVRLAMLNRIKFNKQPEMVIQLDNTYTATLNTEKGKVVIELFTRAAPNAVNNFVFLAKQGWYNNITFFLVTSEYVQTGDPSDTGQGDAGYTILDEHDNGLIFDREGLVAMAHPVGMVNGASSQFFITLGPMPPEGWNKQYTIFGRVTEGMDVLRKLTPRNPFDRYRYPNPAPGDRILTVDIAESKPKS